MTDSLPLSVAARIVGKSGDVLRSWRHRRLATFCTLGTAGSHEHALGPVDLAGVVFFAAVADQNRDLARVDATLAAWLPTLERLMAGEAEEDTVFAVEFTDPAGTVERFLARGPAVLADAMRLYAGAAASVFVLNLSEIVARASLGWRLATEGEEKVRAELLELVAAEPEEVRRGRLAHLDAIARRINPTRRHAAVGAPKTLPAPDQGERTDNGSFLLEAPPAPAVAKARPKVFP